MERLLLGHRMSNDATIILCTSLLWPRSVDHGDLGTISLVHNNALPGYSYFRILYSDNNPKLPLLRVHRLVLWIDC